MTQPSIYEPFSSLVNTIWWLDGDQYNSLLNAWQMPGSPAVNSLCWFHPIQPCFQTCFTLVVLQSCEVIGDGNTDVLYSSLFASSQRSQLLPAQVYAFKQSTVAFGTYLQLQAYRVRSRTEFVPLASDSSLQMVGVEGWPVSVTGENGRVIFFVSLRDLPLMEHEFARRRGSGAPEECMFVHRCIYVKKSAEDVVLPLNYFRPLVKHQLLMRSWGDLAAFPDSPEGRSACHQAEQQELLAWWTPPPSDFDNSLVMRESEMDQLLGDMIGDVGDEEAASAEVAIQEALEAAAAICSEEDVFPTAQVSPPTPPAPVFVFDEEEEEQEIVAQNPQVLTGCFHAPVVVEEEEEEEHDRETDARPPSSLSLATLTAVSLSRTQRKDMAKEKQQQLVAGGPVMYANMIVSLQSRPNLEAVLRVFYSKESQFAENMDSLQVFFDVDMLIRLVQLSPYVTTQYFGTDNLFYEKWHFALYLSSRSFLHALGLKDPKYLECSRNSRVAKELLLDGCAHSLHTGDQWTCSICQKDDHVLPTMQSVFEQQMYHSDWDVFAKGDYPCSRCSICWRSLSDHLPEYVERAQPSEEEEDIASTFRLCAFPYYNTFAFARLSCKCLKRDYCLSCLAEVHATANLKNDRMTGYDEEESWCLCLESTPDALNHFNVLTRGQHASLGVLTSMQLRLCYIWYRQMKAQTQGVRAYRNVMLLLYSPLLDDETHLTQCFQGSGQTFPVVDGLCVQMDPVAPTEVNEVEFCLCLQKDALISRLEERSEERRLRVICCRLGTYVEEALYALQASFTKSPLLALGCTDNMLTTASSELLGLYAKFESTDDARKTVLFSRCTATGKIVSM